MSFAPRGIEIFDLCVMLEKQRDSSNKICEPQRKGDNAMAERKQTSRVADLLRKSVEAVAEKKANANCFGFMYEPKRPEKLVKK
ncbi:cyclic lactone autoinducer peptide [Clostridium sp. AM42-36]|jgi:cyclic lactone autoinducer peptide|nr:cyclic lactone autoinducer peptide [Clostridium sp. AM42-36]